MKTPKKVKTLSLQCTCMSISEREWDRLTKGTTKASGSQIRKLIKEHLPELYDSIGLDFYNPYEHKSVKKPGLLVYEHSAINYFLKYT